MQAKLFRLPSYIFRFKDGSLAGSCTCIRCTPQTTSSSVVVRLATSFFVQHDAARHLDVETDVHGERSKRRRGGRRRGELTGSQQVTASPSFYYLLSLSRSSGYSLSFPPPSTLSDSPPRPSIFLDPFVQFLCVYFRLTWIVLQVGQLVCPTNG